MASLWRIQLALTDALRSAVLGSRGIQYWLNASPKARRHLYDTPRRRAKQSARVLSRALPIQHLPLS
jgi:hypothetical protein